MPCLFVVGPPGVGKTTLVRALLDHLDPEHTRYLTSKPKWTVAPYRFCAAGHYQDVAFDGADTVPYNGVAPALEDWSNAPSCHAQPVTVFDGDRFSHESAVRYLDRSSVLGECRPGPDARVLVAWLTAPPRVLDERRASRGSPQCAAWALGRATKARRFATAGWGPMLRLDASRASGDLLGDLVNWLRENGLRVEPR